MSYDLQETIAALATAPGGAARGVVRLSGPRVIDCLAACFVADDGAPLDGRRGARRIAGVLRVCGDAVPANVAGHVFLWSGSHSFTRQPAAEFHAAGSPPLLAAALAGLCRHGARPAAPGEFTLRAFLGGRIDLTQAEAVLGIVDAQTPGQLEEALAQLAGGLSRPLHALREDLLGVLAELEAGLDFADEPIEFIAPEELDRRLAAGVLAVAATLAQLSERARPTDAPRVALVGAPNVGKSSLFNALVERYGVDAPAPALVSSTPGATRDYLSSRIVIGGSECCLIDSAGSDDRAASPLDHAAQQASVGVQRAANLRLHCCDGAANRVAPAAADGDLMVRTKSDLGRSAASDALACSSMTGQGIAELAAAIHARLAVLAPQPDGGGVAATAARCAASLREAQRALGAARDLVRGGGDELLAAEMRSALDALGDVVGAVTADEVLDRVFSQFCIGK